MSLKRVEVISTVVRREQSGQRVPTGNNIFIQGIADMDALVEELGEEFLSKKKEDEAKERIRFQRGIAVNGKEVDDVVGSEDEVDEATDKMLITLLKALNMFLRKDKDDRTKGTVASDRGFEVGNFEQGEFGSGGILKMDEEGNSYLEVDKALFRKVAYFVEVVIKKLSHVGGSLVLSPASMKCSKVEEFTDYYRCFFENEHEGRTINQEFVVGDQARSQTFNIKGGVSQNVGNRYYWRLVVGTGDDYIDLSKADCDSGSGIPQMGDEIVLCGNRDNPSRQNALILSSYGEGTPSLVMYKGIKSYSLADATTTTKLSPEENKLTGIVRIEAGSTGTSNLEDFPEEVFKTVHIGAVNLLLNSGFTGDYRSEELTGASALNSGTELFSKGLKHWTGSATVNDDGAAVSGKSVTVGSLSQTVEVIKGESYVVSFKGKGASVRVILGGESVEKTLSSAYEVYYFKFVSDGIGTFSVSGDATICDLQLERGTIATDWKPSPYDNDKTLAEFQSLKYLQDAIVDGDTTILGGLILSSIIKLGNYKDGVMQKVNAGISGIYNDSDDVAFWGGGTLEQAIRTIIKFKENPRYRPTEADWADLANFAVSHGGDVFLRGYVYALGGFFRGAVEIAGGKIMLNDDGSGHFANGGVRWDKNGVLFRRQTDVVVWSADLFNYASGAYFDISTMFVSDAPTITIPEPPSEGYRVCIALKRYLGTGSCRILGVFRVHDVSEGDYFFANTLEIYRWSAEEYWLTYSAEGYWSVETDTYSIEEGVVVLGMNGRTSVGGSVIDKESVSTSRLIAAESVTVSGESESSITTFGGIWAVGGGQFGGSVSVGDGLDVTGISVFDDVVAMDIAAVGNIESYGEVKASAFKTGDLVGKTEDVTIKATDGTHVLKFVNGLFIEDKFTANS